MYTPVLAGCIVNSCVVLHNILINHHVNVIEQELDEIELQACQIRDNYIVQPGGTLFHEGTAVRNQVSRFIFE
jgi:hypothetical protein